MTSRPSTQDPQSSPSSTEDPWFASPKLEQLAAKYHADIARIQIEHAEYLRSIERSRGRLCEEQTQYLPSLHLEFLRREHGSRSGFSRRPRTTGARRSLASASIASTIHEPELAHTTSRDCIPKRDTRGGRAGRMPGHRHPEGDDETWNETRHEPHISIHALRSLGSPKSQKSWLLPSESDENSEEESRRQRSQTSVGGEESYRTKPRELQLASTDRVPYYLLGPRTQDEEERSNVESVERFDVLPARTTIFHRRSRFPVSSLEDAGSETVRRIFTGAVPPLSENSSSTPRTFSPDTGFIGNRRLQDYHGSPYNFQTLCETQNERYEEHVAHSRSTAHALHMRSSARPLEQERNPVALQLVGNNVDNSTTKSPKLPLWRCYCPHVYLFVALTLLISLVVSVVLSTVKRDMSDGFTVGGYLIAVGSVVVGVLVAKHNDICVAARHRAVTAATD